MENVRKEKTPALRRQEIMKILNEREEVRVIDLSKLLDSSVVTIRKDLDELEKEGMLERTHGGAIKNYRAQQNLSFIDKKNVHQAQKKLIAQAAAKLVKDGESIIINVGSTSFYVAQELKNKQNLIVITNALQVFNEIGFYRNITTFFLGGKFDAEMQLTYGDDTMEQLSKYKADKLFIGMDGVDLEAGATSYNHIEDAIMRQMMEQAKEKILVVDDSKIGKVTFAHIAPLSDFDAIVTNYCPQHENYYLQMENMGLHVITV
ncbi:MAG: DeoR/GlpR family DNA-binding transcription regulator [Christensenella sp.]|nr:DeoR/GlpR family DNA-binding transcription regulator [Christensenella sp.]